MVLRAFNYAVGKRRARLLRAGGLVGASFHAPARSTPAGALRPARANQVRQCNILRCDPPAPLSCAQADACSGLWQRKPAQYRFENSKSGTAALAVESPRGPTLDLQNTACWRGFSTVLLAEFYPIIAFFLVPCIAP